MAINGLDGLQRRLESMKDDIDDAANEAVSDALDATERRAKRNIVEQDAVQTTQLYRGFLKRSFPVTANRTRHLLTNIAPHAKFQEYGTGDQFGATRWSGVFPPPSRRFDAPSFSMTLITEIETWILQKPSFRLDGDVRRMAVEISLSLSGLSDNPSGHPPQPFMRPAWFVESQRIDKRVQRRVSQAIRRA